MFGQLNYFLMGLFYENFLLLQPNKVSLSENHALPGEKIMKTGLTVGNSVYQTHKNSVYQTIQFTKHYSSDKKNVQ